jgi:hypothetical protein
VTSTAGPASSAVREALEALLVSLCKQHGIAPVPTIEWSTRMRRLLGRAYPSLNLIRMSAWLDDTQAEATMRHELAHIAAGVKRQAPHGPVWQAWAVKLGIEPRATSREGPANAPTRTDRRQYWGLECSGCGLRLARMRVLTGLYHRDCGPRRGGLRKVVQGQRDAVLKWVVEGERTKPA